jgi:hypothetical protein
LNEIFKRIDSQTIASGGTDDALRDGLPDPERITNRQNNIADLNRRRLG